MVSLLYKPKWNDAHTKCLTFYMSKCITFIHYVEYIGCPLMRQTGGCFTPKHKSSIMTGIGGFRRRKSYGQNKILEAV